VSKLCDNEVDTTHFFSSRETWKHKDKLLIWVCQQENRDGFTVIIKRSCAIRNSMLELVCERSGEHKVSKKRFKHEATGSTKYGCLFKLRGYVAKDENAWKFSILNGVHNHEMLPYLAGYLLVGRLMEDDNAIVDDFTNSSVKPKKYFDKFEEEKTIVHDKYKASLQ